VRLQQILTTFFTCFAAALPLLLQAVSERAKEEACAGEDEQQCCVPVEQLVKFVWGLLAQGSGTATAAAGTTAAVGASTGAQLSITNALPSHLLVQLATLQDIELCER
jgi:hypothetical protein